MQQGRQGFTLLELMMVVVIIGILATIALPQYFRSAERARVAEASSLLGTIRVAEMRYKAQSPNNVYTTVLGDLDIELQTSTLWSYAVNGTAAGANAAATRLGASVPCSGKVLELDLDTGATCSTDATCAATWGVGTTAC